MVIKVEGVKPGFFRRVANHCIAIILALLEAIFPSRITVRYPKERRKLPDNFRGMLQFDIKKCISCSQCAFICPANAIKMMPAPNGKYYPSIDYTRCIFCHFCVDTCPRGAWIPTKFMDTAYPTLEEMFLSTSKLLEPPELVLREDKAIAELKADASDMFLVKEKKVEKVA